jgi:uncharacterized protein with GYD domain
MFGAQSYRLREPRNVRGGAGSMRPGRDQATGPGDPGRSEETTVPFYLYQLAYSPEAIKAMVASPSDRKAAAEKMIESIGGKLHHLFFAFGKYDVVCLIEAPDDAAMAAGALAVASTGTTSATATTKLMTAEEAMGAMQKAGQALAVYRPPMG